ncbi:dimethylsulfonioproprionate lyase family protein [Roseibium sp. Sym1]|uniref:dimethylsulfonioproprionate lyase family protein n=1 Tax=Roseibium sp. Sym1 TaxID=3016006 RepID=UPI0022B34604|nr:dimethylsulfonioproprionate lyase family protein [Roseibium sp. Sym1]
MNIRHSERTLKVLTELARVTAIHLRGMSGGTDPDRNLARQMAHDLEKALGDLHARALGGRRSVRGLRFAPQVFSHPAASGMQDLHDAALDAFSCVNWTEFYDEDDWSRPFLSAFANGEGIGPDGVLQNSEVILGLFLQGPDTTYPVHAHPATEFYIPVTGQAEFQVGDDRPFVLKRPGDISLHHRNDMHSIRTGEQPLFAVFGWFGEISKPSWYLPDTPEDVTEKRYPTIAKG